MLWAHDVSNILEYKPSLKLLTIIRRTGLEYCIAGKKHCQLKGLECGGLSCAMRLKLAVIMLSRSED